MVFLATCRWTLTLPVVVPRQVPLVPPCSAPRRQMVYGWFCWFRRISRCVGISRCVPLIIDRPKDFGCGGDFTGAVLGQGNGHFYRCRGPDSFPSGCAAVAAHL